MVGFLSACRAGDYRAASSYLNLRRSQNGPELAQQLQSVLDRSWRSDPASISDLPDGDRTDGLDAELELLGTIALEDRTVELLLERVTVDGNRLWLFSNSTVTMIPLLFENGHQARAIEGYLPAWMLRQGPLQTAIWVWLALLVLVAIAFTLASVVSQGAERALRPLLRKTLSDTDDRFMASVINPMRLLLAFAAFQAGLLALPTSVLFRTYLGRIIIAATYLALAWVAMRIIDAVAMKAVSTMGTRHVLSTSSMVPLARRTAKAAAVVFAVLATLNAWGYNTTALLAGLGVGGLAVALAAQRTLENLFGGVSIATDRPVLVGDYCRYGERYGIVEDIGLRSTRLRTLDRTVVTIPNGQFSSMEIENFGRRDKIFFHPTLNLRRDTTPDQVRALIAGFREILLAHPKVDPNPARVRFVGIGQYSLDLEIFSYVQTTSIDEFLVVQEELLLSILDLIAATGTALALPAQLNLLTRDPMRRSDSASPDLLTR